MRTAIFIILAFPFSLIPFFSNAQNLVPDSSFEILNVPKLSDCYQNNINQSKYWSGPMGQGCLFSLNAVNCHPIIPHSGKQYAGYYAFADALKDKSNKSEVIETKLTKTLEKGKTYTISALIRR